MWKVQLFELNYDELEIRAVEEVVRSGWITMGPKTSEFESEFQRQLDGHMCTAVSSGTAALHLALLALQLEPGDEVIVPALTFVADANVVRMVGAKPVFADCESMDNWNIGVESIRQRITDRTRAVICVHYAGYACRMAELRSLCDENGLALVEDVAHAPGGTYGDRPLGTIGDLGCFSFFTNKNLSVGEGGMVAVGDPDLDARIRLLRSHGMTTLTLDRHEGRAISYDVLQPGLNYRIDEMRAALGLVQLAKLPAANRRRAELSAHYDSLLEDVDGIQRPFRGYEPGVNTFHICPVILDGRLDRDAVIVALRTRGIQASIHYPAIPEFEAYVHEDPAATPLASDIAKSELTLPLYPTMGRDNVDVVCEALADSIREAG
ncbi:MAG: DegT/DnrJ/EryC1/StrS family aminotransferase [Gemmatimonadetes bacterium]|nr:DegT/DnrJ/EryC1/StrS family aminotransferase [Gemmatimonadota bacterium]